MQSTQPAESSFLAALSCLRCTPATPAQLVQSAEHGMAGVRALLDAAKGDQPAELVPSPRCKADEPFKCLALGQTVTRRLCVINQLEERHSCCNANCKVGVSNQEFVDLVRPLR